MEDDVPDYMSSVFLVEQEMTKEQKRMYRLKRKRVPKEKDKPVQEVQKERLEEGVPHLLLLIVQVC
jgi:hypothetical protein